MEDLEAISLQHNASPQPPRVTGALPKWVSATTTAPPPIKSYFLGCDQKRIIQSPGVTLMNPGLYMTAVQSQCMNSVHSGPHQEEVHPHWLLLTLYLSPKSAAPQAPSLSCIQLADLPCTH